MGKDEPIAFAALGELPKTAEGAVKLYDDWAGTYDKTLNSWGYEAPRKVAELVQKHVQVNTEDAKVLDLGCGTGMSGQALLDAGLEGQNIVGVDISPKSVELAGLIYERGCFVGSLEEPLPEEVVRAGPYDAVSCVGTTSYVHKFDVMFAQVLKVLNPGGIFVFTHRDGLWNTNQDSIQTVIKDLVTTRQWIHEHTSEASPYMPNNPDPAESSKRIFYVICRKTSADPEAEGPADGTTPTTQQGPAFNAMRALSLLRGMHAESTAKHFRLAAPRAREWLPRRGQISFGHGSRSSVFRRLLGLRLRPVF